MNMKTKIRVMVADADADLVGSLTRFLNKNEEYEFVGAYRDGCAVLEGLKEKKADILIMDLVLPKKDGLAVLEEMKGMKDVPEAIITSDLEHTNMIRCAFSLGAAYYICKPYMLSLLDRRIKQVFSFRTYTIQAEENKTSTPEEKIAYLRQYSLESEVTSLILELGIPAHIKGYQYIRDGILFSLKDKNMLNYITKFLYPTIAKKYKTTSSSVERAIRHAIGISWERGNGKILERAYGYSSDQGTGRPTNSEFLALIVDKIRLDYRRNA